MGDISAFRFFLKDEYWYVYGDFVKPDFYFIKTKEKTIPNTLKEKILELHNKDTVQQMKHNILELN